MKLIALLSWFDEDPNHLTELVESLGRAGVDHLVAVDGAYRLWPGDATNSLLVEYVALHEGCDEVGMDLTLHRPRWRWFNNELEKRNLLFSLGHSVAEPYNDWLWVIDGDEVVTRSRGLRRALEAIHDVGTVTEFGDGNERRERRLFRAHPKGIQVVGKHSHYVSDGLVLWGRGEVQATHLDVEVYHRPHERSAGRIDARNAYYEAVKEQKAELLT